MRLTRVLTAAFLVFTPVAGFAMCSDGHEQASSCANGYTWDDEAKACVEIVQS